MLKAEAQPEMRATRVSPGFPSTASPALPSNFVFQRVNVATRGKKIFSTAYTQCFSEVSELMCAKH